MKKLMLIAMALTALTMTSGCDTKSDTEKKAENIEDTSKRASDTAKIAYDELTEAMQVKSLEGLNDVQLGLLRDKYMASRNHYVSARADFVKALSDAEKNKDKIKVTGKEGVRESIKNIDSNIEIIDFAIRKIDRFKAARKMEEHKKSKEKSKED